MPPCPAHGLQTCRLGGAKVLLAGVALWSVGTLFAPPAAHISLFALCATRAFVRPGCSALTLWAACACRPAQSASVPCHCGLHLQASARWSCRPAWSC